MNGRNRKKWNQAKASTATILTILRETYVYTTYQTKEDVSITKPNRTEPNQQTQQLAEVISLSINTTYPHTYEYMDE